MVFFLENIVHVLWFKHGGTVGWGTVLQVGRSQGVIVIFHWYYHFGHTIALWLTQLLTEMSTRNTPWGVKLSIAYGWQPYHISVPIVLKSGSRNLLKPSGPVLACLGIALPLHWFEHTLLLTWIPIKLLVLLIKIYKEYLKLFENLLLISQNY